MTTPRDFVADDPRVRQALATAVTRMEDARMPVDASVNESRFLLRNGEHLPLQGAPDMLGSPSLMNIPWVNGKGFDAVLAHGNSYMQTVTWDEEGVVAEGLLAPSQSTDPESPHYADMTRSYSAKEWPRLPFRADEIRADPALETLVLSE